MASLNDTNLTRMLDGLRDKLTLLLNTREQLELNLNDLRTTCKQLSTTTNALASENAKLKHVLTHTSGLITDKVTTAVVDWVSAHDLSEPVDVGCVMELLDLIVQALPVDGVQYRKVLDEKVDAYNKQFDAAQAMDTPAKETDPLDRDGVAQLVTGFIANAGGKVN